MQLERQLIYHESYKQLRLAIEMSHVMIRFPYKQWPEDWGNDDGSMEVEAMYDVDDVADQFS